MTPLPPAYQSAGSTGTARDRSRHIPWDLMSLPRCTNNKYITGYRIGLLVWTLSQDSKGSLQSPKANNNMPGRPSLSNRRQFRTWLSIRQRTRSRGRLQRTLSRLRLRLQFRRMHPHRRCRHRLIPVLSHQTAMTYPSATTPVQTVPNMPRAPYTPRETTRTGMQPQPPVGPGSSSQEAPSVKIQTSPTSGPD